MATTAIKTKKDGKEINLLFMTVSREDGVLDIDIFLGDEQFMPHGTPSLGIDHREEEAYHRALREEASTRGDYMPEFSTNPEWNEGYVAPEENKQLNIDPSEPV